MELQGSKTMLALTGLGARAVSRLSKLGAPAEARLIAGGCVVVTLACVLMLVLPGRTFSYEFAHDVMIFFDGADRVLDGQFPNRDFHTPLGLLAYLLPAFGLWAGGSLGGMMPIASAAFALILLPMVIHVCVSRLPLGYAVIFALFVITLAVTPASIGDELPSFAMFYNRWGYALLAVLLLLPLPPLRGADRPWLDACVVAVVLVLTFYLKISYFVIGAAFATALLVFGPNRRAMGAGLLASLVGIVVINLLWGGTFEYFQDISSAAASSGVLRNSIKGLAALAFRNAGASLAFVIILGIVIARRDSWWSLVLSLGMAGAGLLLANQNAQGSGLLTLVPAAIVALVSTQPRPSADRDHTGRGFAALALLAVLAFPQIWSATGGVVFETWAAARGGKPDVNYVAEIDGFMVEEVARPAPGSPGLEPLRLAYRNGNADLQTLAMARNRIALQTLAQPEYLWTIQDAVDLLRRNPTLTGGILVLDMANPLNALTGRSAPQGMDSWFHNGRTFSETVHRDPGELFGDVGVVMVPKAPVEPATHGLLTRLYGDYIAAHYELVATSDYWQAYKRRLG